MTSSVLAFGSLNYAVLTVYLLAMIGIGAAVARRQKTGEEFFLAGRRMPWLAVGMSMFASVTSATTFMGVPGFAFKQGIALLFAVMVSPLVVPVLVFVFYPFYRRLNVTTSYEYILKRFGASARYAVSAMFVLARLGWLGVVIYAPAKALSVVAGMDIHLAIGLMGLLAVAYTTLGGLAAVIWTDVVQFIILIGGAVWVAVSLAGDVPGGIGAIIDNARSLGRFDVWEWRDVSKLSAFGAMIAWFFFFMSDYGVDQITVQRMMAVKDQRGMARAASFNAVIDIVLNGLLIFIGLGMLAYYGSAPADGENLLPTYIMQALPAGVSGLVVTAIFAAAMSSMDSGINSVATVIINDFLKPLRIGPRLSDVALARVLTVVLGVMATVASLYAAQIGGIIETWGTVMGLFAAPVLGLFLLGMLTRRANFVGWVVGAAVAIAITVFLMTRGKDMVSWAYRFPISAMVTVVVGYIAAIAFGGPFAPDELTVWRGQARRNLLIENLPESA